jgi:hypothetical protein
MSTFAMDLNQEIAISCGLPAPSDPKVSQPGDQHQRHAQELHDRHEVAIGIVGHRLFGRRIDGMGVRDERDRVAVGAGLGERRGADDGVAARAVVDDDRLAEIFRQLGAQRARHQVGPAARRIGHDPADRPRRPGLGLRRRQHQAGHRQTGEQPGQPQDHFHRRLQMITRAPTSR